MKSDHLMIDCETLGIASTTAILSLGAVFFDEDGPTPVEEGLYVPFKWVTQVDDMGRTVTGSTLSFWMRQQEQARESAFFLGDRVELHQGLIALREFMKRGGFHKDSCVWAKGPSFDLGILTDAYRQFSYDRPWTYWQEKCVRTALLYGPADRLERGDDVQHHALDDAVYQARQVAVFLDALRKGKKLKETDPLLG